MRGISRHFETRQELSPRTYGSGTRPGLTQPRNASDRAELKPSGRAEGDNANNGFDRRQCLDWLINGDSASLF